MKISLVQFSMENFKIFKERAVFSMVSRKNEHTFLSNEENLLKTSLIYGPNATGKSTVLEALGIMKNLIIESTNIKENMDLPYFPFVFSEESKNSPMFLEIIFSLGDKILKYNFSILKNEIIEENLFEVSLSGESEAYITRKNGEINLFKDFEKSNDLKDKTRKEVLFLSTADQWNNEFAISIVNAFRDINLIKGLGDYSGYTIKLIQDKVMREKVLKFLKTADFCITNLRTEEVDLPDEIKSRINLPSSKDGLMGKGNTVFFAHDEFNVKNEKTGEAELNLGEESVGTQKFFSILGPIVDTITNGKILLIDEFDNSLHPFLTKFILDIFEKNNPKDSQLIVTGHDTSILSYKNDFNKEQFWFTEKNKFGAGKLFSLNDFDVRNDTEYAKKYLEGRFGALPIIRSLDD